MSKNQRKTVMIVEDDLILNLLYESYLDKLGYDAEGELVYGKTAIEVAKKSNPTSFSWISPLKVKLTGLQQ